MNLPSELSLPFLIARLEEELLNFRTMIKNLPLRPSEEAINNLLNRSIMLLQGGITLFEGLNNPTLQDDIRKSALNVARDTVESVKELYDRLENRYPLFLDTVTVFFEPLSEKLNHLLKVLEGDPPRDIDYGELSEVLGEIVSTLEVYFSALQRLEDFEL